MGYGINLNLSADATDLLAREAELADLSRKLDVQLHSLRYDHGRFEEDSTSADELARVDKTLRETSRQFDIVRREIAKLDTEGVVIRKGLTASYAEIQRTLEL